MKILCISDTHYKQKSLQIPECDVLIFSGDCCNTGAIFEFEHFVVWLASQSDKFKKAIVVAGNHDWCCMINKPLCVQVLTDALGDKAIYLEDSECVIDGIKFYGSPWQPEFCSWAFNKPRGEKLKQVWENIPDDVNVLITHGPPHGICDKTVQNMHVGCEELFNRVRKLDNLFLHVFGHIHSGNGVATSEECLGVSFCNAAICNEAYEAIQPAHQFTVHRNTTRPILSHTTVNLSK